MLLDPEAPFDATGFEQLAHQHRWLELMFQGQRIRLQRPSGEPAVHAR
ncbi:MAG: hypothetical protein WDM85_09390 [Caulobacteraceae bacterium]